MRFHPTRGAMTLGQSHGGLTPDNCCEDESAVLADMDYLINTFHDNSRCGNRIWHEQSLQDFREAIITNAGSMFVCILLNLVRNVIVAYLVFVSRNGKSAPNRQKWQFTSNTIPFDCYNGICRMWLGSELRLSSRELAL